MQTPLSTIPHPASQNASGRAPGKRERPPLPRRGGFRRRWARFAQWGALAATATAPPLADATPADASGRNPCLATAFATSFRAQVREVVLTAALLDPDGGNEDVEARREHMRRQGKLRERIASGDATAAVDARRRLANAALLELPVAERRAVLRRLDRYLDGFVEHFSGSLADSGIVSAAGPPAWLVQRLRIPLQVQARYFPAAGPTRVAAMYYQPASLMLFNPAVMAECPDQFIDALEHELWHHLLPIPETRGLAGNLWWEGFNEAVAEWWGHHLHRRLRLPDAAPRSVEYPVDTAFATLLLAVDQTATLRFMAGEIDRGELLQTIETVPRTGPALGRLWRESFRLSPARRERVEILLESWRWRGADGQRVDIGHLLVDGVPQTVAIDRAFADERRLLMDVIQAWSATLLQDWQHETSRRRGGRRPSIPPPALRRNLRRVLDYVQDPYYQLANR